MYPKDKYPLKYKPHDIFLVEEHCEDKGSQYQSRPSLESLTDPKYCNKLFDKDYYRKQNTHTTKSFIFIIMFQNKLIY